MLPAPHPPGADAVSGGAGLVLAACGPEGRVLGWRSSLGIPLLPAPGALLSPSAVPGPAMGNVPSAVKHCLSYQQLLREHLWIGDSVAGALDPAQVPPRGPGCPHPFVHSRLSPCYVTTAPQGPPCSSSVLFRPHLLKGSPSSLCCEHADPPL